MKDGSQPLMDKPRTRVGRTVIALTTAVATALCLTGCGGIGVSDISLEQGAMQTIKAVKDSVGRIPDEWVLAKDAEDNSSGYCGGVIDTGPNGSAYWAYGFALDFKHPVSNAELLELMTPLGKNWKLHSRESNEQGGSAMDYSFSDGRTQLEITLNGESATRPRIGVTAYSDCIRNGTTGPGTFPTPNPADVSG